jgi:hypothetical protein
VRFPVRGGATKAVAVFAVNKIMLMENVQKKKSLNCMCPFWTCHANTLLVYIKHQVFNQSQFVPNGSAETSRLSLFLKTCPPGSKERHLPIHRRRYVSAGNWQDSIFQLGSCPDIWNSTYLTLGIIPDTK